MKNRKQLSIFLYALILVLAFSWMLGIFGERKDRVAYSGIVTLFEQENVKEFEVEGNTIRMALHTPVGGKTKLVADLADPEGFHRDMKDLFDRQIKDGILLRYNFVPESKVSPYDYILPIVLAGLVLLFVWMLMVGKANSGNPMANFGKARTMHGQPDGKKVTLDHVAGVDE